MYLEMRSNQQETVTSQLDIISDVGARLRAYRIGAGLTPEQVAQRTGISRAAIYRYESGQPIRVDVLGKIADLLDVSLTSLLGVGSENFSSALTFFERLHQIEQSATQINVLFGPISYLLTTSEFDAHLGQVLWESVPENAADRASLRSEIDRIMEVLLARKATFQARRPNIVSLVSAAELEQFLAHGFIGRQDLSDEELTTRHSLARKELEHVVELIRSQPMGVQIGVVVDSMPGSSFQVLRSENRNQVAISPFRLGSLPNVRIGVATVTSAKETIELHLKVTERLWHNALKGQEAVDCLTEILRR